MNDLRIVGVDLAAAPSRTGVVILDVTKGQARATLPPDGFVADDNGLVALVTIGTVIGVDAPLGWPDEFVHAIVQHSGGEAWPQPEGLSNDDARQLLRRRATDRFVMSRKLGSTPLSVSSDLIGVVAMRAALLQTLWATCWGVQPRDGTGQLIETYPAVALRAWGLYVRRYKSSASARENAALSGVRQELMNAIDERASSWLAIDDELRRYAIESDHALDALVCCLVALATKVGQTHGASPEEQERARREGWIHVPSGPLADLGSYLV